MSIASKLSYSLGRKDQEANKKLAREIADAHDGEALNEIIKLFQEDSPRRLLMDAMLTIGQVGERNAKMLIPHVSFLLQKLSDEIERVGWGSMIALSYVAPLVPDRVFEKLSAVLDGMARSSVVGRDHGFRILVHLYQVENYRVDMFYIIQEQLRLAPSNQVGQYIERLILVLNASDVAKTIEVLEEKRMELENPYHIKRLDKNLKKLYNDRME